MADRDTLVLRLDLQYNSGERSRTASAVGAKYAKKKKRRRKRKGVWVSCERYRTCVRVPEKKTSASKVTKQEREIAFRGRNQLQGEKKLRFSRKNTRGHLWVVTRGGNPQRDGITFAILCKSARRACEKGLSGQKETKENDRREKGSS